MAQAPAVRGWSVRGAFITDGKNKPALPPLALLGLALLLALLSSVQQRLLKLPLSRRLCLSSGLSRSEFRFKRCPAGSAFSLFLGRPFFGFPRPPRLVSSLALRDADFPGPGDGLPGRLTFSEFGGI